MCSNLDAIQLGAELVCDYSAMAVTDEELRNAHMILELIAFTYDQKYYPLYDMVDAEVAARAPSPERRKELMRRCAQCHNNSASELV
ncbi:MAG: hypothetical protein CME85_12280 [Henriciella sp.]|jgi:hypothetical protein|nr:hypothetical protein [Henriciella sp.]MBF34802.1 hypothetical protein [Hyphomonadaceae bacterium]MBK76251.1 hypothetical protein [Henriciella sp.]PHR74491.1 MAG: hypothetical protein COA64_14455 [Henriciella sp.]|tara:strand:- start:29 stop:289 length:261 start_codon:yes stop_codon:yes gene_type:complete